MDFPPFALPCAPKPILSSLDPSISDAPWLAVIDGGTSSTAGLAWGTANRAKGVEVVVTVPLVAQTFAWLNGTTVSGNVSCGIFDSQSGKRMIGTAGVAQSGANAVQTQSLSATALKPGRYFIAMVADNTTATFAMMGKSGSAARIGEQMAVFEAAAAYPMSSLVSWPYDTDATAFFPWMTVVCAPHGVI